MLIAEARRPSAVQRLQCAQKQTRGLAPLIITIARRGLTLVVAGGCDGNQTYCAEVVAMTQKINAEKLLNVVVADQLKDGQPKVAGSTFLLGFGPLICHFWDIF